MQDNVAGSTATFMVALAIYREGRGASPEARQAIANVIRNRVQRPGWWGNSFFEVVTKPFQFSSFNRNDVNVTVFARPDDPIWAQCWVIAESAISGTIVDNTGDATFYYTDPCMPVPVWATKYKHLCDIGRFHFFTDKL